MKDNVVKLIITVLIFICFIALVVMYVLLSKAQKEGSYTTTYTYNDNTTVEEIDEKEEDEDEDIDTKRRNVDKRVKTTQKSTTERKSKTNRYIDEDTDDNGIDGEIENNYNDDEEMYTNEESDQESDQESDTESNTNNKRVLTVFDEGYDPEAYNN